MTAVDGVSFEIAAGTTFGLLGPNGAGKTTTIHMLVGALEPDSGTVTVGGQTDDVAGRIGIAPQSLALYEQLTAEENLRFFGKVYGLSGARLSERVRWCLDFVALESRRNDRAETYSGGMKRRLNLACAVVHDPAVIFMDEPTVGVDPQSRNHIFDSIEALRAEGKTILYTTHYMEEAERLCDRVAIMDQGKILAEATVPELVAAHGGLSTLTVELSEAPPEGVALPGELSGSTLEVDTDDPTAALKTILGRDVHFSSVDIRRPDLESVFLNLTGRSLRD